MDFLKKYGYFVTDDINLAFSNFLRDFADYQVVFSTDDPEFGGNGRVDKRYRYIGTGQKERGLGFYCYLPARSAIVFGKKKRCQK